MSSLCGSCEKRAGRFQCAHCALVYCSAQCARIGLGANDDIVGLESADGFRFEITRKQAERAQTLLFLIEDAGTQNYVHLPNIDGATLERIVRYLRMEPIVLDAMSREEYFDLIRAANYLDFKDLLDKLIPLLLTQGPLTDNLLRELRGLIFPALFFVPDLREFRDRIVSRNVLQHIVPTIDHMLRFIQKYGINNWAIRFATENGHVEVVRLLLADPRVDPSEAIRWAAFDGHVEVVRLLLAHKDERINPAAVDNYAIRRAAENGHTEVVRLLLADPRINPAAKNNYAILWATINGHIEVVRLLLADRRVDPSVIENITNPKIRELLQKRRKIGQRIA